LITTLQHHAIMSASFESELMATIRQQRTLQATVTAFLNDDRISRQSFIKKHKKEVSELQTQIVNLNIELTRERVTDEAIEVIFTMLSNQLEDLVRDHVEDKEMEIDELRAEILRLDDELSLERDAHERTKQSADELQALTKSINDKMEIIIDQTKSQSPKGFRVQIKKAQRKIKAVLRLNKQTSDETTVPIV
jgi:hypothetical protein